MNIYYYLFYSFIIYSFLGWCLEVVYHLHTEKKFINRGFLYGPICPIYGVTAVTLSLALSSFQNNIVYLFIAGAATASVIELMTGYMLELFFHTKWWDYSSEKYNIKGYICLRFSLIWGGLSVVFIKLISPNVSRITYWVITYSREIIYNIILIALIADIALTINGLITFKKLFVEIQEVLVETKHNMDKLMERNLTKERNFKIQQRLRVLIEIKERLSRKVSLKHRIMLRAYPKLTSKKFGAAIEEIKKKIDKIKK